MNQIHYKMSESPVKVGQGKNDEKKGAQSQPTVWQISKFTYEVGLSGVCQAENGIKVESSG